MVTYIIKGLSNETLYWFHVRQDEDTGEGQKRVFSFDGATFVVYIPYDVDMNKALAFINQEVPALAWMEPYYRKHP